MLTCWPFEHLGRLSGIACLSGLECLIAPSHFSGPTLFQKSILKSFKFKTKLILLIPQHSYRPLLGWRPGESGVLFFFLLLLFFSMHSFWSVRGTPPLLPWIPTRWDGQPWRWLGGHAAKGMNSKKEVMACPIR